jgi:hypothetical protein
MPDNEVQGTHWEDCWRSHHACAIAYIERLEADLKQTRSDVIKAAASLVRGPADPEADEHGFRCRHARQLRDAVTETKPEPGGE